MGRQILDHIALHAAADDVHIALTFDFQVEQGRQEAALTQTLASYGSGKIREAGDVSREYVDTARDQLRNVEQDIEDYVHAKPFQSLAIAAGLGLGGNESYPDLFQPFGGFPDGVKVENSFVTLPELPGIGFEGKADLFREMTALSA